MFKLVLEKAEEQEVKRPTSAGSWKKQESSRKTSISALLTMPKPLYSQFLECEVKWALGSVTMNKASGGDGIPAELLQILKVDAVKMMHSICQ